MDQTARRRYTEAATRSVGRTGPLWWLIATVLASFVAFGVYALSVQIRQGHAVTGVTHTVFWGFYIVNFVFFIGISYGGAIVSAILRLTNAKWRAPISRIAEATAVVTLGVGAASVLMDVGRPDRMLDLFIHAQPGSPITWDWVAINTYLVGTLIFFFLPLIPDLASYARAYDATATGLRAAAYRVLSFGWRGAPRQERSLLRSMTIMSILIIPLAVSVHSVLAWLFAVTVQPGWNSTIFAPYFVVAAMFSGIAMVILVIALVRKAYGLEEFIGVKHFRYLSYLLIALDAAYIYFVIGEYLTEGYMQEEPSGRILQSYLVGSYAPWFWSFAIGGLLVPLALVIVPGRWFVGRSAVASALVIAGMWVKRFLIVILPGVSAALPPSQVYHPSWVEIGVTMGSAAAIPLGLMVIFAIFPVMSVHEMEEVEGTREAERPIRAVAPAADPAAPRWWRSRVAGVAAAAAVVLAVAGIGQGLAGGRVALMLSSGSGTHHEAAATTGASPAPAAAAAEPGNVAPGTTASMNIAPSRKADQGYVVEAQIAGKAGAPLNQMSVQFYDTVELLGAREMLIGTQATDGQGRASVAYLPAGGGSHTVIARYATADGSGEVRSTFTATVVAPDAYHAEKLPLADMSLSLPRIAGTVLLGVWLLFAFALIGAVRGIAAAPQLATAHPHTQREDHG